MRLKQLRSDKEGTAVIEFAMAAPVLVTIMIGILQFALVLQASGAMRHGLGEGLRYAKVNPVANPSDPVEVKALKVKVEQIAKDALSGIDRNKIKSLEFSRGIEDGAEYGKIDMEYDMEPIIPFVSIGAIKMTKSRTVYLPS